MYAHISIYRYTAIQMYIYTYVIFLSSTDRECLFLVTLCISAFAYFACFACNEVVPRRKTVGEYGIDIFTCSQT